LGEAELSAALGRVCDVKDDAEPPSVFGPSDFIAWEGSDRTKPLIGEAAAEVEHWARESEGVVPARPGTWTAPAFLLQLSSRIGKPEARRVADFVAAWVVASEAVGHPATAVEYAAHWGLGEATGYRELRTFKSAFPTEPNPERLAWALGWVDTPWIPKEEYERVVGQLLGRNAQTDQN
jgi:hypothetical protein